VTVRRQVGWLTAVVLLSVLPKLLMTGTNIVTITYGTAAERILHGILPYQPAPGADMFKYSPFFALAYSPLTLFGPRLHAALWACVNISVFWYGVSRWFLFGKETPAWLWAALILCSMEMDGSLRYQQVNAFLAGLMLLGLADYRDGNFFRSGFLLTVAANLKVVPLVFVLALLYPIRGRYLKAILAAVLITVFAPALVLGLAKNFAFHRAWAEILVGDLGKPGLLDIETVMLYFGASPFMAKVTRLEVIGFSLLAFGIVLARRPARFPWEDFIPCGLGLMLLASPRTESPTFVLFAPAYIFLVSATLGKRFELALIAIAMFLITFAFNDLWPKAIWNPSASLHFTTKTLGVFVLWLLAGTRLVLYTPRSFQASGQETR
jgi:hypothetical protein